MTGVVVALVVGAGVGVTEDKAGKLASSSTGGIMGGGLDMVGEEDGCGAKPGRGEIGRLCAIKGNVVGKKGTEEMRRDELREKLQIMVGGKEGARGQVDKGLEGKRLGGRNEQS